MKLFIWNDPYKVRYGGCFAYAIAPDVETARRAILSGKTSRFGHEPDEGLHPDLNIDREPDRVLDGPVGEVYEWEE